MLRSMFAAAAAATTVLCALLLCSCTASAATLKSVSDNPSLLSLNISYWQGPSSTFQFPTQRSGYSVAQLPTISTDDDHPDEIIIMGGLTTPENVFGDVWKSLDEGNTWTQISTSYPSRYQAAVCVAAGSNLLAIGGWLQTTTPGGVIPGATDSYMSRSRGVDWERISSNQPFFTSPNTVCSLDGPGTTVFLWLGDSQFSSNVIQLWRAKYTGSGIMAWEGISTPASDGKFLLDRKYYAVRFLPHTNQLLIAGGFSDVQSNIIKETLTLSLGTAQNVSAWTRATITADWPSSSLRLNSYFVLDNGLNLYLYTSPTLITGTPSDRVLWMSGSAAFDTWIPVDLNSTCSVAWNPIWGNSISGVLSSYTQGTPRLLFLDDQMINPTRLMALQNLNQQSTAIVLGENFNSISMCASPDHNPGGHPAWMLIGIIAGAAVVVIGCIVFFVCSRRNRNGTGINSPLLSK